MLRPTSHLPIVAVAIVAATAIAACGSNAHNSSGSSDHLSFAQMQRDAVNFASCMHSHGVPFPDPTASPRAFKQALNPSVTHSPAFNSAVKACQHLLPDGGQPNQSPARSHAQVAAMMAFARCIRTHGFPSFPDPTSSGDLTREMIANAGINVHQPATLRVGDACVSVTHGLITQAAVARFIAGH